MEVNRVYHEFYTFELQKIGVVYTLVKVYPGVDFVRRLSELLGGIAEIKVCGQRFGVRALSRYFDENTVMRVIARSAIDKILKSGEVKDTYEVYLSEKDVDFTEIEKEVEKARIAEQLCADIRNEIDRLEKEKVVAERGEKGILLVDETFIGIKGKNIEELEKIYSTLKSIDGYTVLRNLAEKQWNRIKELETEIQRLKDLFFAAR